VGETLNLAARLQTVGGPDMVVISDETMQLVGRLFEYADMGRISLKGLREPTQVWAVTGLGKVDNRFQALRHGERPLVNREDEIATLRRHWQTARLGQGRAILLSGEAGIGKSRLMAAFADSLGHQVHRSVQLVCSSYHTDTPLYPVIRYLERAASIQWRDAPSIQHGRLQDWGVTNEFGERDIAMFANLLSLPPDPEGRADDLAPRQRKEQTFSSILRLLRPRSNETPLLVLVEDLHWADPTTLELLGLVVDAIEGWPALLVVTSRPERHPHWASKPGVINMVLNGLTHGHSRELIAHVLLGAVLPSPVVERIVSHSDGVPLFVEELTTSVLESHVLLEDGRRASPIGTVPAEIVPRSLQASLLARLDRHTHLKEIAQTASVLGREFSFPILQKLSRLPAYRLKGALEELTRGGILLTRGTQPESGYSFKHALLQDAAYGSMLRERRRVLHRRLAEALVEDESQDIGTAPQIVAWHYSQGGVPERAVEFYLQAAERATGRSALTEIVSHLRNGLREVKLLPECTEKANYELQLQVALGRALIDQQGSGSDAVCEAFERARELCLELRQTEELLRVHDGLMNHYITRAQPEQVLHNAAEMLEVGRTHNKPQAHLMALRSQGFANLLLGRFVSARNDFQQLLDLYESDRDGPEASLTARDPKVSVATLLAMCLTVMGYPEAGAAMTTEAIAHAERLNHVVSLVLGLRRACVQCMIQQDAVRALHLSQRLLATDADREIFLATREGGIFNSWARLQWEDDATLHEHEEDCIDQLGAAKHWLMLPFFLACAAERRGRHGDRERAAILLQRAAEIVARTNEAWCLPEILRLQGCYSARDSNEAERMLRSSLTLARTQGAKLWELRTSLAIAVQMRDRGDFATAQDILKPVVTWFSEGGTDPDLQSAQALLRDL
jgi:hypothetical protein